MAIITISRELAALGDETSSELAKLLGYRLVNKETMEKRFIACGFNEKKMEKYDEKKPGFWASLSQDRDDYLHHLKTAMCAEALEGNAIFLGRGSMAIFRDVPATLSLLLVAPLKIRMERVKSYFRCDDKRAGQIIEKSDHDRAGFHSYFFDMEWKNPAGYHMVLNTGCLHINTILDIITEAKKVMFTPDAESLAKKRLQEMSLGRTVVGHILYDKKIPVFFLETEISDREIVLKGVASSQASVSAAVAAGQEIAGSRQVRSEIQLVQEYGVLQ